MNRSQGHSPFIAVVAPKIIAEVGITWGATLLRGLFGKEQLYLGDLLTMVFNYLLTGMILQVHIVNVWSILG